MSLTLMESKLVLLLARLSKYCVLSIANLFAWLKHFTEEDDKKKVFNFDND